MLNFTIKYAEVAEEALPGKFAVSGIVILTIVFVVVRKKEERGNIATHQNSPRRKRNICQWQLLSWRLSREEKNFFKTIPPLFQTKFTIPITAKPVELKEGKSSSKSVIPKALKYVLILKIFLLLEHF